MTIWTTQIFIHTGYSDLKVLNNTIYGVMQVHWIFQKLLSKI